jgi:hypothetical protein
MIEGKEPMRTFGDLLQFMKVTQGPEPAEAPSQRKDGNTAAKASATSTKTGATSAEADHSTPTPPTAGSESASVSPEQAPAPVPGDQPPHSNDGPESANSLEVARSANESEDNQRPTAVPPPHSITNSEHVPKSAPLP